MLNIQPDPPKPKETKQKRARKPSPSSESEESKGLSGDCDSSDPQKQRKRKTTKQKTTKRKYKTHHAQQLKDEQDENTRLSARVTELEIRATQNQPPQQNQEQSGYSYKLLVSTAAFRQQQFFMPAQQQRFEPPLNFHSRNCSQKFSRNFRCITVSQR